MEPRKRKPSEFPEGNRVNLSAKKGEGIDDASSPSRRSSQFMKQNSFKGGDILNSLRKAFKDALVKKKEEPIEPEPFPRSPEEVKKEEEEQ